VHQESGDEKNDVTFATFTRLENKDINDFSSKGKDGFSKKKQS
jgi:hypothetical protein